MALQKVSAVQDDSSHWYIVPSESSKEFYENNENEQMNDTGDFDEKWGKYRTGGDLNLVQLYADLRTKL
jgi:hypothetical protein